MYLNSYDQWKISRIFTLFFLGVFLLAGSALAQESEDHHAQSDAYWAQLAQSYPAFNVDLSQLRVAAANELNVLGEWGPVLDWPHIPVSAAHLPDGRILTWASNEEDGFPGGQAEFTYAAAWDPVTEDFKLVPHNTHDMFCAHQVMLEDGRLLVMGGRNTVNLTSIYDPTNDTWVTEEPMANGRWYPTAVGMPDGDVMIAVGSGGGSFPEVWNDNSGWRTLSSVNLSAPILNYTGYYENNWWPLLHVAPDGDVFHSGPTPDMHKINTAGTGSIVKTGPQITDWYPKHGATIMYDEGKLLVAGGAIAGGNLASTNRAMTIDITGGTPIVNEVASMHRARKFQNGVMLPGGEVLIVGGNTSGSKFSDDGTVLSAEMWDPDTGIWTELSDMSVPRNYHSVALLMTDGRVWVGGGGLCGSGCAANHMDAQIYSPPYLFNGDGSLATRPSITNAPATVRNGASISIDATAGLAKFSMIKMSSTTHGVNSDVRYLDVSFAENGAGSYDLDMHSNLNVLTPGNWMLFGIDANGVPSEAAIINISTEGLLQATNPGTQVSPEGAVISLVIQATSEESISFSASGLPGGLSMNSGSGEISGVIDEGAAGTYNVDVTVSDALGSINLPFTWAVTTGATGEILREWWSGIAGNEITLLTGNSDYPDNPDGTDLLTSFETPTNWADEFGTRIRGYIYPPVTGDYTFWIATDDNGELWLSSDDDAANVSMIANVPGWSASQEWYKFPEQQSATISLVAGERYYIEALQKEGGGGDNTAVAWQIPGGSLEVIAGGFLSPYSGEPTVDNPGDLTSLEGTAVSVAISATDPENDALIFSGTDLPEGISIDINSGVMSGTPTSAGSYDAAVSVSDGINEIQASFTWTVLDPATLNAGVAFEYYEGVWDLLPDFDALNAKKLGVVDNFGVTPRDQDDNFAFRHRGFINIEAAGDYTFYTTSDDGSKLSINGTLVVDNDGLHGAIEESGVVNLDAGFHAIEVTVFEKGGAQSLAVQYEGPGITKQGIPNDRLSVNALSNQAPELVDVVDQTNGEGEATVLQIMATDPDGDDLTYSATGLPTGVTLNTSTGLIGGGIVAGASASSSVTVTVTDGDASASTSFTWSVNPAPGTWIDFDDDTNTLSLDSNDGEEKDLAVGDLDKDGWDDIVVVRKEGFMGTGARADMLLMNEAGTLVDRTTDFAPGFTAEQTIARDVIIEDLDGDGWDDVLIANTFGDQPSFYRNLGESGGTWLGLANESSARLPVLDTGSIQYCSVAAGDVNGDGAPDLYFSNYVMDGTTEDVLLINDGSGNFTDEGNARLGNLIDVAFGTQANIIDMDADGDGDIVKLSANQPSGPYGTDGIFVLYNDGTGNFSDWSVVPSDEAYMYIIGDFNNDSAYDFYIVDDGADYVNMSNGVTANSNINFTQETTPWVRTAGHGANLRIGDLDLDGDLDIGVADVDTSEPPCVATDLRSFLLLENKGSATGEFIDPYGAADKPWSTNMYDFVFVDINNDGNLDIFTAECAGYGLFTSTEDPVEPPVEPSTLALGDLNLGIAAHDSRTGPGYVMYSEESVHTRFASTPPSGGNADHLIAVVFDGTWKVDRNKNTLVAFTPQASDRLLVEIDFGADTVTHLNGTSTVVEGINAGYESGDLVVTPEMWAGSPNGGEFGLAGTEVVVLGGSGNSAPVLAAIGNQMSSIDEAVSLSVSASDSDGDQVSFAAGGLPSGLDIAGSEISGTPASAGTYTVTVTATDGNGGSDSETFTWTIDGGDPGSTVLLALGDLNLGIAAHDDRTGMGYIMYSEESVHTRFADNPPSGGNADHLISVVYEGEWKVDRNKRVLVPFTPRSTDQLVAEVDFGADVVTHMQGLNTVVEGIAAGYVSGDLVVTAEMWAGSPNGGEFGVVGTTIEIAAAIAQGERMRDQLALVNALPESFALGSIYPNPFGTTTTIEYQLPEASSVRMEVYSITGQRVRVLAESGKMQAGYWQTVWDGSNDSGKPLAAGVYIIRFQADGFLKAGKVVLVK
ncbi:MAG: putative Ig domain-containing protein [Rhodothermales bacterium]